MPIMVADSNFLRDAALIQYLDASRANKIALAEEVLTEMHKGDPAVAVPQSLAYARRHPKQIVIIRSLPACYGMRFRCAADVRRMIDPRQTMDFAAWYDDVLSGHLDLSSGRQQARAQIEDIAANVAHLQPIFRKMKKDFNKSELAQIRRREAYQHSTQAKLIEIVFRVTKALFLASGVKGNLVPVIRRDAPDFFIFRYGLCMTLLFTRWVHLGNLSDDRDRLVNDVIDMHLAALGTFFGGILTRDQRLSDIQKEARYLLRLARAFVG